MLDAMGDVILQNLFLDALQGGANGRLFRAGIVT